ncbi:MAG: phosphoribosyltransferase domain-containing protein [Steroidobacteraceae bacterium]
MTDDGQHLYVDERDYERLIERLAVNVHESGWSFDTILCLARGGLRPGDVLSRLFDKPLAIMSTSSYRAEAGTFRGHLDISHYISTPRGEIAGKVLLVDDLADTGHTLQAVVERLRTSYPAITELRSAVLWVKAVSTFTPDYRVEFLATNPWIHQPFEVYDSVDVETIAEKLRRS